MSVSIVSGWLVALALSVAWYRSLRRLRSVVNKGIHELRRPLQQAFLLSPAAGGLTGGLDGAIERTLAALDDLDARANRRSLSFEFRPVDIRQVVEECLDLREGTSALERPHLRWNAEVSRVFGNPDRLRSVFDNLIDNAARHGSPPIWISADGDSRNLRVAVGNATVSRGRTKSEHPFQPRAAHGYGHRIVREVVGEHGGRFASRQRPAGYEAVVELPLVRD